LDPPSRPAQARTYAQRIAQPSQPLGPVQSGAVGLREVTGLHDARHRKKPAREMKLLWTPPSRPARARTYARRIAQTSQPLGPVQSGAVGLREVTNLHDARHGKKPARETKRLWTPPSRPAQARTYAKRIAQPSQPLDPVQSGAVGLREVTGSHDTRHGKKPAREPKLLWTPPSRPAQARTYAQRIAQPSQPLGPVQSGAVGLQEVRGSHDPRYRKKPAREIKRLCTPPSRPAQARTYARRIAQTSQPLGPVQSGAVGLREVTNSYDARHGKKLAREAKRLWAPPSRPTLARTYV
jgi:hypothetical protein